YLYITDIAISNIHSLSLHDALPIYTITYYFKLNEDKVPEFKNEDFRLAFAKAIDKKAYVKNNLNNGSIPADNFVPKDFVKDSKCNEYQDGVKNENHYNIKEPKEHRTKD